MSKNEAIQKAVLALRAHEPIVGSIEEQEEAIRILNSMRDLSLWEERFWQEAWEGENEDED